MRLRRKPGIQEKLAAIPRLVLAEPKQYYGQWKQVFANDNPLHLEIGTGKGSFISGMAQLNPRINYIGIERVADIIYKAAEKIVNSDLTNVRLIMVDARDIPEIFQPGEVSRLYLNFSDPWPKKRHAKRRLTHPDFLRIYQQLLPPNGEIHLKTDNKDFFEYSLQTMSEAGFILQNVTYDLHKSGFGPNVMTEYEMRFSQLGQPIYRLEALMPRNIEINANQSLNGDCN